MKKSHSRRAARANTKGAGSVVEQLEQRRLLTAMALGPVADSLVRNGNWSSLNYGSNDELLVKLDGSQYTREAFIRFDLSTLSPDFANGVGRAVLRLTPTGVGADIGTTTLQLQRVADDSWIEGNGGSDNNPVGELTWNNRPTTNGVIATWTGESIGSVREIDITAAVREELATDPTGILSMRIAGLTPGTNRFIYYGSKEHSNAAARPQLVLEPLADAIVYSNNFEHIPGTIGGGIDGTGAVFGGTTSGGWSPSGTSVTPGTSARAPDRFLGHFGAESVTLSLADLPAHQALTFEFDVYFIRSWDGDAVGGYGPDIFSVTADGATLLDATFRNVSLAVSSPQTQSYPVPGSPARSGALENDTLGYTYYSPTLGQYVASDSVYRFRYTVAHMDEAVALVLTASGLQSPSDETWGVDNVTITAHAPVISGPAEVDEGESYNLALNADGLEVDYWWVDWGDDSDPDGDGVLGEIIPGNPATVLHVYEDGHDEHQILAQAWRGTTPYVAAPIDVVVNNVAPVIIMIEADRIVETGAEAKIKLVEFLDPAAADREEFTATVDWGDGSPPEIIPVTASGQPALGEVIGRHRYVNSRKYEVKVTLRDGDGGEQVATTQVLVAPNRRVFTVPGESGEMTSLVFRITRQNDSALYKNQLGILVADGPDGTFRGLPPEPMLDWEDDLLPGGNLAHTASAYILSIAGAAMDGEDPAARVVLDQDPNRPLTYTATEETVVVAVPAGKQLMFFMVQDAAVEHYQTYPNTPPDMFFNFVQGNWDKVEHFARYDLPNGGARWHVEDLDARDSDNDWDDIVFTVEPIEAPVLSTDVESFDPPEIRLTWNDSVDGEDGYEIWRSTGAGQAVFLDQVGADQTTYVDSDVSVGTTYTYIVRAVGTASGSATWHSPWSNAAQETVDLVNRPPKITSVPRNEWQLPRQPSNSIGPVSPASIEVDLAPGQTVHSAGVSVRVPAAQAPVPAVDVFILLDDTGSFTQASQNLRPMIPDIVQELQQTFPGISFAFGVGRFEDYYDYNRPFILNQPIVETSRPGFMEALQAALAAERSPSPDGGDGEESSLEGLYQLATGAGLDNNGNGSKMDSGRSGSEQAQIGSVDSAPDVPPFSTFEVGMEHMLPPAGARGGAGFRAGALPIILLATDVGTKLDSGDSHIIYGEGGVEVPREEFLVGSTFRPGSPTLQGTVTALNALGAKVIGLGAPDSVDWGLGLPSLAKSMLEAFAKATGAISKLHGPIQTGPDTEIRYGDPLYFPLESLDGSDLATSIVSAVSTTITSASYDVDLIASDPEVIISHGGVIEGMAEGQMANFDVVIENDDGKQRSFDLLFVQANTGNVLGAIPVTLKSKYEYQVVAADPEGDSLHYSVQATGPDGLPISVQLDSQQKLTWEPSIAGTYHFIVTVADRPLGDPDRRTAVQEFDVTVVVDDDDNAPPSLTAPASTPAYVNEELVLDLSATDPDHDVLAYYLVGAPVGLAIDTTTGRLIWTPTKEQIGRHEIKVQVRDGRGGIDERQIAIVVAKSPAANRPPVVVSPPSGNAVATRLYTHDLFAVDYDEDIVTYHVKPGTALPAGMSLDRATGAISWIPADADTGSKSIELQVRDSQGAVVEYLLEFEVLERPLNKPTTVAVLAHSDTRLRVTWAANTEANLAGYNVYRAHSASGPYLRVNRERIPAGTEEYLDFGLQPSTSYHYRITAVHDQGVESDQSDAASGMTDFGNAAPNPPANAVAEAVSGGISLSWNQNQEIDLERYYIFWFDRLNDNWVELPDPGLGSDGRVTYIHSTPIAGEINYYMIYAADDSDNWSTPVEVNAVNPDAEAPPAPLGMRAYVTLQEIGIRWEAYVTPVEDLVGFDVYRSTSRLGTYTKLNTTPIAAYGFDDRTALSGIRYFYKVKALDLSGNESEFSTTVDARRGSIQPDPHPPLPPQDFAGTLSTSGILLTWKHNAEADLAGYILEASAALDGPYVPIHDGLLVENGYNDQAAVPGQTRYYRLYAVDTSSNRSAWTAYQQAVPPQPLVPPAPTAVAGANTSATRVYLQWSFSWGSGDVTYRIYRGDSAEFEPAPVNRVADSVTAARVWLDDPALVTERIYYYKVTAVAGAQESLPSAAFALTVVPTEELPAPDLDSLDVQILSATRVRVSWSESTLRANAYLLMWQQDGEPSDSQLLTPTARSVDIEGLSPSTQYTFTITASNDSGSDSLSEVKTTPAASSAPDAPLITDSEGTYGWNSLWWTAVEGADGYRVYRKLPTDSEFSLHPDFQNSIATNTEFSDDSAPVGLPVEYYVTTVVETSPLLESDGSNIVEVTRKIDAPPATPEGLRTISYPGTVVLLWEDHNEDDFSHYEIERDGVKLDETDELGYYDRTLTAGTTATYSVYAVDHGGQRSAVPATKTGRMPVGQIPNTPGRPIARAAGEGRVRLSWDSVPPDADGVPVVSYRVLRAESETGEYVAIGGLITDTNYLDATTLPSTTYFYRLLAIAADDDVSFPSEAASVTSGDGIRPAAPASATAIPNSATEIEITWDSVAAASGYHLYVERDGDYVPVNDEPLTETTYLHRSLDPDTLYRYAIVAVDGDGDESDQTLAQATTEVALPEPPHVLITAPGVSVAPIVVDKDVSVRGIVDDINNDLARWQLLAKPLHSTTGGEIVLAEGTSKIGRRDGGDGSLGAIRPTLLSDGLWTVWLTAWDDAETSRSTQPLTVRIRSDLKLGNLVLPFTDLEVPIAGGSIAVTRVYDSTKTHEAGEDLAPGWRWQMRETGLTDTTLASMRSVNGIYALRRGDLVHVMRPDGGRHTFAFLPKQLDGNQSGGGYSYEPHFLSVDGSAAELLVPLRDEFGERYIIREDLLNGGEFIIDAITPYHPALAGGAYTLKLPGGTTYTIDAKTGFVRSSADANGNVTTYGNSFVRGADGSQVAIERSGGRVTGVRDLAGRLTQYVYDPESGDLLGVVAPGVSSTGRKQTTTYVYENRLVAPAPTALGQKVYAVVKQQGADLTWNGTTGQFEPYDVADLAAYAIDLTAVADQSGSVQWHVAALPEAMPTGLSLSVTYHVRAESAPVSAADEQVWAESRWRDNARAHLLTGIIDARGVKVLAARYDASNGQLTDLKDSTGAASSVSNGQYDGISAGQGVTDAAGNDVETIYDSHGSVEREIRAVRDGSGAVIKYAVTVHKYEYMGPNAVDSATGRPLVNILSQVTTYRPFEVAAPDLARERYSKVPDHRHRQSTREFHVVGKVDSPDFTQVSHETVYDQEGNARTTTYSNYLFGKPQHIQDADGRSTQLTYDPANGNLKEMVDAAGQRTVYLYSDDVGGLPGGLLIRSWQVKQDGTRVPVQHNTYHDASQKYRLKSTTDAAGLTTRYTYYDDGQVDEVYLEWTDQEGRAQAVRQSKTTYDAAGRAWKTTDQYGQVTETLYNLLGKVDQVIDAYGGTTSYLYDVRGNLIQTEHPDGTLTRSVYDVLGRAILTTDRFAPNAADPVLATRTIYDQLGRVVETQRVKNVSVSVAALPSVADTWEVTAVDGAGVIPDANRAGVWALDPGFTQYISRTRTVYDSSGRAVESIDTTDLRSGTVYYDNGQVRFSGPLKNTAPANWSSQFVGLDTPGVRLKAAELFQHYTEYNHDQGAAASRYSETIDALGHATWTYTDALGRTTKVEFADGSFTETFHGAPGALATQVGHPGWAPADYMRHEVQVAQRKAGDPVVATHRFYDASGRLTDVLQPAVEDADPASPTYGKTVRPHYRYTYDARGNQLTQMDANGRVTSFAYDLHGRRTSRTLPPDNDGNTANDTETWTYDSRGRMLTHTDFKGQGTRYVYDDTAAAGGRLVSELRFNAGVDPLTGTPAEQTDYGYDALGRRNLVLEGTDGADADDTLSGDEIARQTIYGFDGITGNIEFVDSPEGLISYEYDEATGRLTRTYTAHNDTEYGYDGLGRLYTVTATILNGQILTGGNVTTYTYDAVGNQDTVTYGNGVKHDYGYDELNRLITLDVTDGEDDLLFEQDYVLLSNGQRDYVIEKRYDGTSSTPFRTVKVDWAYDALDRLTEEVRDEGNDGIQNGGDYTDSYSFDIVGNRIRKTHDAVGTDDDSIVLSVYNGRDQLIRSGKDDNANGVLDTGEVDSTYTYDANGSTISVTSDGSTKKYRWDLRNRMTGYDADGDGIYTTNGDISYTYDHDNQRVGRTDVGGETTKYLLDYLNPTGYAKAIEERDGAGNVVRSYIFGHDVIAQSDVINGTLYLVKDGRGNTRALTGGSSAVVERYDFDVYGNKIRFVDAAGNDLIDDPLTIWLMPDGYRDFATGLDRNGVRDVAGYIGRMWSRDPYTPGVGDMLNANLYVYAGGNPIHHIDPSGMLIGGLVDIMLVGFGRLAFETISFASRYAPAISTATTVAGAVSIASGITLILQENDFIPRDPITPWVFAVSGIIFSAGMSLQTLNMTTSKVVAPLRGTNGGTLLTGGDANAAAIRTNPTYAGSPPYAPTVAAEGRIGASVPLVRVYSPAAGTNASQMQGSWVMPKAEVMGLTPAQIRAKYALPNLPTHIVDVDATRIAARTGTAGQNFGAAGGGVQVQLLEFGATFSNPRPINGVVQ